jgi:hypothetical protein
VLLCLAACSTTPPPQQPVVIHYQHVANAHQVRFTAPLAQSPHAATYVTPRNPQGFWAIFVLCSLDVTTKDLPSFVYDVNNFRVDYNDRQVGPLSPYSVRYERSYALNNPRETSVVANAIAAELNEGPPVQVFASGFYPSLNYRIALFVPKGLEGYAGEALKLQYIGQPSVAIGNGYPPFDIPAVGGSAAGVAASCLP